ncbi:MAG: isoleucine--tRNA ligase [Catalinimonas sp.]
MKYPEYKQPNLAEMAEEIRRTWQQEQTFERSVDQREGRTSYTFYEGPPSANGTPGIHHVMARAVKDLFCRYRTQKGFQVKRKGGWDTHGLPIEIQVEKELGIIKDDIGKTISVEEYNARCREAVMKYKGEWDDLTERMGYWVDLHDPYVTFEPAYIETLWQLLKRLYEKDLLYKGYTIQPFSPAAGTGLSSHELNQPGTYRDVKDTSVVAQFKVIREAHSAFMFEGSPSELFFIAWTTTPWTLPANTALAIGERIEYVRVETFNAYTHQPVSVVLAEALLPSYFSPKGRDADFEAYAPGAKVMPWRVTASYTGRDLVGVRYEQLMPYVQPDGEAFRVIPGDFVSTEDGTGIVHISPTFGADDARVAQQHDIPPLLVDDGEGGRSPLVDRRGRFVPQVTDFAGQYVKNYDGADENDPNYRSTDVQIAIKLKEENRAFRVEKYEHSYPHCWRTDKPILYYPLDAWFIRTTAYKDELIRANETINWKPAATGVGRFGNWLENLVDWNLSRSRYWGTPLPIWRSEGGEAELCVGSYEELSERIAAALATGLLTPDQRTENEAALVKLGEGQFDPHRPFVDRITLVSAGGQLLHREPDLIDVWFDSGAMPYAQHHYPFENREAFAQSFPADFIAEGVDQTRGWFFTLHALGVMLFDSVAYRNVIANGLVLDRKGNKMSKRLGNAVDPFATLRTYGPDATRWYMIANAPPWDNLKFNAEGIQEVQRKFFGTLLNTYAFFALYANLDGFTYAEPAVPLAERTESDRWVLSRLHSLVKFVDRSLDAYEPTRAARAVQDFVNDDLSNWYVRLNRKRFWRQELGPDKLAAYQTLYTCLLTVSKLMAPVAPFYADRLFRDLNGTTGLEAVPSVHLTDFPEADGTAIDLELERRMSLAQRASSLAHSLRKQHKLKVRQPLARLLIPVLNEQMRAQLEAVEALIASEVNVKQVAYIDDAAGSPGEGVLVKRVKPNFRKLGRQFGKQLKEVTGQIDALDAAAIRRLETEGGWDITVGGEPYRLLPEDVEITTEDMPGWITASDDGGQDGTALTVALDLNVTEELRQEGIARDLVNRVQNLRKEMGLDVQDKIRLAVARSEAFVDTALLANQEYIQAETQALEMDLHDEVAGAQLVEIDDIQLQLRIEEA